MSLSNSAERCNVGTEEIIMNRSTREEFTVANEANIHHRATRREFVKSIAVSGVAVGLGARAWAAETRTGDMIYRTLGRTGEKISAIGLGGYHIGVPKDEQEGIRIIRSGIDRGINFLDKTSAAFDATARHLEWLG